MEWRSRLQRRLSQEGTVAHDSRDASNVPLPGVRSNKERTARASRLRGLVSALQPWRPEPSFGASQGAAGDHVATRRTTERDASGTPRTAFRHCKTSQEISTLAQPGRVDALVHGRRFACRLHPSRTYSCNPRLPSVATATGDAMKASLDATRLVAPTRWPVSTRGLLWVLTALMVSACAVIAAPLLPALAWALALAIAGEWLRRLLAPYCRHPGWQAGLSIAVLAMVVAAPLLGLAPLIAEELQRAWAERRAEPIRARVDELAQRLSIVAPPIAWLRQHAPSSEDIAAQVVPRVSGIFASSIWGALQWLVAFFVAFYFLRDRQQMLQWLSAVLPFETGRSRSSVQTRDARRAGQRAGHLAARSPAGVAWRADVLVARPASRAAVGLR